jgi:hypothetical protein
MLENFSLAKVFQTFQDAPVAGLRPWDMLYSVISLWETAFGCRPLSGGHVPNPCKPLKRLDLNFIMPSVLTLKVFQ